MPFVLKGLLKLPACDGMDKQVGDACILDGKSGRCQVSDGCVTKDLAHWDHDASIYPPAIRGR